MKIAIGADHGGYRLKEELKKFLKTKGHKVIDFGTHSKESCDYPEFSFAVARSVAGKKTKYGLIVCKSGIGSAIAANKVKGARAAVCNNQLSAKLSREHNDANVCVFGSRFVKAKDAKRIISLWLRTRFSKGRHARRVGQIIKFEKKSMRRV